MTGVSESSGTILTLFSVAFDAKTIAEASNFLVSSSSTTEVYEGTAVPSVKGAFTSDSYSGSSWTQVAVPEPSTAALALAGLALLLKRRKA